MTCPMTSPFDTISALANSGRLADWEMAKALLVGAGVCEEQGAEEYLWNRVVVPEHGSQVNTTADHACGFADRIEYDRSYWGFLNGKVALAHFWTLLFVHPEFSIKHHGYGKPPYAMAEPCE